MDLKKRAWSDLGVRPTGQTPLAIRTCYFCVVLPHREHWQSRLMCVQLLSICFTILCATSSVALLIAHASHVMHVSLINKHLKNVGPIRHCEPPHALILYCHSPRVAMVASRHCRTLPTHRCP